MNDEQEQKWRERTRRAADELDAATASRLRAARTAALAQLDRKPRHAGAWLLPAGVAAGAALAAVLVMRTGTEPPAPLQHAAAEDLEILLSGEDLELYADLDFYQWLEAEDDAG